MNTQAFADWSSGWTGPLMELQQINQAAAEKVVRECISYGSACAADGVKCAQTMQRVSSPEEYFSTQVKILSQQGEKTMEFCENLLKIAQDALRDHFHWTEQKVSTVSRASKVVDPRRKDTEDR